MPSQQIFAEVAFRAMPHGMHSFRTDSYAAFGQIDYSFTERFTGILGFRYTDEERNTVARSRTSI